MRATCIGGLAGIGSLVWFWGARDFGSLDPFATMRIAIPSATAIALGLQIDVAALFLSLVKWPFRSRGAV